LFQSPSLDDGATLREPGVRYRHPFALCWVTGGRKSQGSFGYLPLLEHVIFGASMGFYLYSSSWTNELFSSIMITSALTAVLAMAMAFFIRGFAIVSIILLGLSASSYSYPCGGLV
jgi:apolipoprotein N-acyltransferase